CHLSVARVRRSRWLDDLWGGPCGRVSPDGRLCRPCPQGGEAGGPASRAVDQIRVHHQFANGADARVHRAADLGRPGARGDRITVSNGRLWHIAADVRYSVAIGGKPEVHVTFANDVIDPKATWALSIGFDRPYRKAQKIATILPEVQGSSGEYRLRKNLETLERCCASRVTRGASGPLRGADQRRERTLLWRSPD